jgi:predicted PP-loop superfamily ATPase
MMLDYNSVPNKVLLPKWIWEEAKSKEHFKKLVLQYMQRYPDYVVKSVKGKFAVCERRV